jgi:hypothetical protein
MTQFELIDIFTISDRNNVLCGRLAAGHPFTRGRRIRLSASSGAQVITTISDLRESKPDAGGEVALSLLVAQDFEKADFPVGSVVTLD